MKMTLPLFLTLLRIALIPVLVLFFYLPYNWSAFAAAFVFILAAITDWLDGYLARRMDLMSSFGAFLDPVADKLMVATALVLMVQLPPDGLMFSQVLFTLSAAIIVGREIAISGLREWMAEMGERGTVKVGLLGKLKTIFQMTAISCLLFEHNLFGLPVVLIGELLLYLAAALTLWSMWIYLRAAWPVMSRADHADTANHPSVK